MLLVPDIYYTRRRRAHFILDDHDEELFSATTLEAIFEWLLEREITEIRTRGETFDYVITVKHATH